MAKDFTVKEYLELKKSLRGIKRCKESGVKRKYYTLQLLYFGMMAYSFFHDEHPFSPIENEIEVDVQIQTRRKGC
jgi:hypothetical protein